MTDIKNLRKIERDVKITMRLAKQKRRHELIEDGAKGIEKDIMRVRGNIASIRVKVERL